jgi:REP element-mobilizing transposase RayT
MVHQPHTNRLRTGRHSQAGFIYSVTTVTARRQLAFAEFAAARTLIGIIHHPDLWQKGFHDRAIRTEADLPAIGRYIVTNPVRAGLVSRVGAYPHRDAVLV